MASLQPFWDFVVILSLLKFLKLSTFFEYLVNHLEGRKWSNYSIKIVRVGIGIFHFGEISSLGLVEDINLALT
jgi:hypothetical protein